MIFFEVIDYLSEEDLPKQESAQLKKIMENI